MPTGPFPDRGLMPPALDGMAELLAAHRDAVARFGLGITPALTFRQVLARIIARAERGNRENDVTLADPRRPLP